MLKPYRVAGMIMAWLTVLDATPAFAQEFPNKPIRLLTSDAGGGSDLVARVIAQGISGALAQPVIVDNRAGVIAQETVAKAQPDGYTQILFGSGLWLLPLMRPSLSYDITKFAPVIWATTGPLILVVHPSVPARSVKDLVGLANSKPGAINYAAGAAGSVQHLASEMLKSMAKVNMLYIPYKGPGAALGDVLAGQVQTMFGPVSIVVPHIKSGKLIALAISSTKPSLLFPGVPTVAEAGSLPGYDAVTVTGALAPARTSAAIVNRLNREIERVLATTEVKEKFTALGVDVVGGTPQVFAAKIKEQMASMGKVIKDAGIRDE
jgi:tripartite-type tricarboxylate transporter receptor subunit TctC